jgi:hypothetical protein
MLFSYAALAPKIAIKSNPPFQYLLAVLIIAGWIKVANISATILCV